MERVSASRVWDSSWPHPAHTLERGLRQHLFAKILWAQFAIECGFFYQVCGAHRRLRRLGAAYCRCSGFFSVKRGSSIDQQQFMKVPPVFLQQKWALKSRVVDGTRSSQLIGTVARSQTNVGWQRSVARRTSPSQRPRRACSACNAPTTTTPEAKPYKKKNSLTHRRCIVNLWGAIVLHLGI